jgi:hypothetical protein
MKEIYQDFVEKSDEHGLIYTRDLGEEDDLSSPIGYSGEKAFAIKMLVEG